MKNHYFERMLIRTIQMYKFRRTHLLCISSKHRYCNTRLRTIRTQRNLTNRIFDMFTLRTNKGIYKDRNQGRHYKTNKYPRDNLYQLVDRQMNKYFSNKSKFTLCFMVFIIPCIKLIQMKPYLFDRYFQETPRFMGTEKCRPSISMCIIDVIHKITMWYQFEHVYLSQIAK